jgi:hypothetical protein
VNSIGPHGHPDPDQDMIWRTIRDSTNHDNRTDPRPAANLGDLALDDETIDRIIDGSDMPIAERHRILRDLAGKPVFGACDADAADVTLRAMLGGYRDHIVARKLPPFNIDPGRVAHLLRRRQRRRQTIRAAYAILVVAFLTLCSAIIISATAHPGDWLWPLHQLVDTLTS